MTHASYNDALFEEEARVSGIYPVGMIGDPGSPPEWLSELWDDMSDPDDLLFQALPELAAVMGDDVSAWADALITRSRSGFIVRFEVCVRQYFPPPATAFQSGWGWVQLGLFYAETVDEIAPTVLKHAREQHEAERQKAGAP